VPFLVVLLLVFRLRDVLVALNQLGSRASFVESILTGALRADGAVREQALQILSVT
jgi:hypothetical protein